MKSLLTILLLAFAYFSSNAQSGSINNINIAQRTDGSGFVDIYFDLSGSEDAYDINIEISFNNGGSYAFISPQFLAGDINSITPGSNKHIIWNGLESFPDTYSTQSKLKIIAFKNGSGGTGQPCPGTPIVTDIDGNVYNTVLIGDQCWMKENLKTTRYRNGIQIDYPGTNNELWNENTIGAYAWYDNDNSWKNSYGALYNWYAVVNSNDLCPQGWHIPTNSEFASLVSFLGGDNVAGGKMKSTNTEPNPHPRWDLPNNAATNESDFTGYPGGDRASNGDNFGGLGTAGRWWSSTSYNEEHAKSRFIHYTAGMIEENINTKIIGFSVRCLKDD